MNFEGKLFSKKDITKLLLPLLFEQMLNYLVGLADSMMVASAGETAVSAVSLVDSVSVLMINIFTALASGGAVVAGQYLGKRDGRRSKNAGEQLIQLLGISSVCVMALMLIFKTQVINGLFGQAEQAVKTNCDIYYSIVMCSVPFIALYNGGAALFRTTGDSRTPMRISVIMNMLNIAGNALLILVFHLGVAGVAIPTLFSRGVAMAMIITPAMKKDFALNLRGVLKTKPERTMIGSILNIGVPNAVENGMFQFGKLLLVSLVSTLGTASITANAIGNTIGSLHCVVGMAMNIGLTAVVSRCVGAGDYRQAREYTKYFVKMTYLWAGIANGLMLAAIPLIGKLYGVSGETYTLSAQIMLIHGVAVITLWPLAFMYNNAMRAAGDAAFAMWITSVSMWLCRVALSYVLILVCGFGVVSIWFAWIVDWLFRMAFFLPRWRGKRWESKAVIKRA